MELTSFYLYSYKNRHKYPPNKYPITHSIHSQNLQRPILDGEMYFQRFTPPLLILLVLVLFTSTVFNTHIHMINAFSGPYHLTLSEFNNHVIDFKKGQQSWFYQIEYIQVEIGEGNIYNPIKTNEAIRRYSNPRKRDLHVATYKKLNYPKIFVKLPSRHVPNFHAKFPFDFSKFSSQTLNCISTALQKKLSSNSHITFINESATLQFIENEYPKNSTLFNMAVLTKCGILIGYLYKPFYEAAFLPMKEFHFSSTDIALETSKPYFSINLLYLFSLIFLSLFCYSIYYLIRFCIIKIRLQLFMKFGFLSFPLIINENIKEELWLLNLHGNIAEQLLHFEELIQAETLQLPKLKVIKNANDQLFVVVLANELNSKIKNNTLPFIICPVYYIRMVIFDGIYYVNDLDQLTCLQWPSLKSSDEQERYTNWLHDELIEKSEDYRHQVENYLRKDNVPVRQRGWNFVTHESDADNVELENLIREEKNIPQLDRLRLSYTTRLSEYFSPGNQEVHPASPRLIASIRLREEKHRNYISDVMKDQYRQCAVCLNEFEVGDNYAAWPCASRISHIFHYECLLKQLRNDNRCPLCRNPAEVFNFEDYLD